MTRRRLWRIGKVLIQFNPHHDPATGEFSSGGGGGRKKGGFAASGETNTQIGQIGENLVHKHLQVQATPEEWFKAVGSNRYNTPLDKVVKEGRNWIGVEVKTMTAQSAAREPKLRMVAAARARKEAMAAKFTGGRLRTVAVVVDTATRKAKIYQKEGIGNFRIPSMSQVNGEFDF